MRTEPEAPEAGESCLGANVGCTDENAKKGEASKGGGEASKVGGGVFEVRMQHPGLMEFFHKGSFGRALQDAGPPNFSSEKSAHVRVEVTNTTTGKTYHVTVTVGWFTDQPHVLASILHGQALPPPGEYTSASLLGPELGFSPDMVTKFLTKLAAAKIDDAERQQALELYFKMLAEACQVVSLSNAPYVFNVLASVPWLNVGLDKPAQECLVGLVQSMLRKVLQRLTPGFSEQFMYDFEKRLTPRAFDAARMTACEFAFRTELVAIAVAMGSAPQVK